MADCFLNGNPMNVDYVCYDNKDAFIQIPDNKAMQETVGEAIKQVNDVLALKSGLSDIFKKDEDLTRGIGVHLTNEMRVAVKVEVIAREGSSASEVLRELTERITKGLQNKFEIQVDELNIKIAQFMSDNEFEEKCDAARALH